MPHAESVTRVRFEPALSKDSTKLSLLLVAIAGGFLERWAVDIIRRVRPGDGK